MKSQEKGNIENQVQKINMNEKYALLLSENEKLMMKNDTLYKLGKSYLENNNPKVPLQNAEAVLNKTSPNQNEDIPEILEVIENHTNKDTEEDANIPPQKNQQK